ncbi:TPA: hypothetical protein ACGOY9_000218 [Streptococcus suis]
MKNNTYRYLPFAIALPSVVLIWLTSADSDPIWLKHLMFGVTLLLILFIFLLVSFARIPQKASSKSDTKKVEKHYSYSPYILVAMTLPAILFNILSADVPNLTKILVLTITPTIGAVLHHRKQKQHEN